MKAPRPPVPVLSDEALRLLAKLIVDQLERERDRRKRAGGV